MKSLVIVLLVLGLIMMALGYQKKLIQNIDAESISRLYGYFEWLDMIYVKKLLNNKNRIKFQDHFPINHYKNLLKNIPHENSEINKFLFWEIKTFLVNHNLNYTDKLSMASGVEVRVPFLDIELVELRTVKILIENIPSI